jgi:hypothetical protein
MRQLLTFILALLWLPVVPLRAQPVSMQAAVSDSTFINVRLAYTTDGTSTLVLKSAYLTRRGQLRRTPVECRDLRYRFESPSAPAFMFSMNFSHAGRRYRLHGSYAESGGVPDCSLRCVPLRLSDKTLRGSEYP